MRREFDNLDGSHLVVERGVAPPSDLAIVEGKGGGHPDTLADHVAERLSRAYSRYTLEWSGAVLHRTTTSTSWGCSAAPRRCANPGTVLDPDR